MTVGAANDEGVGRTGSRALATLALAVCAAAAFWLTFARPANLPLGLQPHRAPSPAMSHVEAAAAQQGQPTTASEARQALALELSAAQSRLASGADWGAHAAMGDLLLARARLNDSYDDYAAAARAFDAAFAVAPAGVGPHLQRAGLNLAVHRLNAMTADLDALDRYAAPEGALLVEALLLRGDRAFYRGRYSEARADYERAFRRLPTLGGDLRLANYHARLGDPAFAAALLDQADSRISGPQQQLRAFIEMRRADLELDRGRYAQAIARLRRADEIFPGYIIVELRLAETMALAGREGEAKALFERLAQQHASPDACDGLALLSRRAGDNAGAERWSARAEAIWSERLALLPEAAYGHAFEHWLVFGDPVRALELARRNHAARPFGDTATDLALALLANGRAAEAAAVLAPEIEAGWRTAKTHVVAAQAYAALGRKREAATARRRALAINPHSIDPGFTLVSREP